jgi:Tol biopolymer transport system component
MKPILIALLAVTFALGADKTQDAERQLKAAMNTELVDGNLKAAIEQYKKVAQSGVRPLAAQALLHMAGCYQKLGDAEARKIYERIVREFGDQTQAAATARAQLGGTGAPRGEAATRRVWTATPGADLGYSSASADGRQFTYIVYARRGSTDERSNLFVHDLVTGVSRQVTDAAAVHVVGDPSTYVEPEENAFSRDGKQLAYSWFREKDNRFELRIVDLTGSGIPRFRRLFDSEEVRWIGPDDWSPDGKWLAVQLYHRDHRSQIGLVSVQDGSLRVVKSMTDHRAATRLFFSPDSRYLAYDLPAAETEFQRDVFVMPLDGTGEIPVVVSPSQDYVVGWSPDGSRLIFSSDRTGSKGLWSQAVANGKPQGAPEFLRRDINGSPLRLTSSGTLLTQVNNGLSSSLRVAAFDFGTGQFLSQPADPVHEFVGANSNPVWSPDGKSLAYLSKRSSRKVVAIRSLETGKVRELEIRMRWVGYDLSWSPDGRAFAVTGNDLTERSGIHRIDAQTGEVSPLALHPEGHNFVGLVWSRDGSKVYYRDGRRLSRTAFTERDLSSGRERELIQRANLGGLNLSPDGKYIATGSQDAATKTVSWLLIPTSGEPVKELMRVNQPDGLGFWAWAPDSRSVFVRKVQAGNPLEVWRTPVDGSAPQKMDVKLDPTFGPLRVNPDQRQVAFQVQETPKPEEVWITENFLPVSKPGK